MYLKEPSARTLGAAQTIQKPFPTYTVMLSPED